ncbi:hypothetical protein [Confluentibacter sediminis]|uniref:hypothetical protein n=1 Tax=Confluentibacter sediminis TaxID=2219045 RepID=UPI0013A70B23|nr:hypothetical protein [Confluentibacter sediminis]
MGVNEFETFETIVEEKYNPGKTILTNIKSRVETSYNQYLTRFDELEAKLSSEFTEKEVEEKNHLQGCYSSLTKTGIALKASIFENQPDTLKAFCPFCLLDKPRTLDHYVGQNEFPEYSFLAKNLIPCCYDCNQVKNDKWRRNNRRRFIHFYYDNFFDYQFLFAELTIAQETPMINLLLQKPIEINERDFQIIQWHFEDLKLLNQYNGRCNTLLSTEIKILKQSRVNGMSEQQIENQLLTSEKNYADDFGINYWKSVMFNCMSQNVHSILSL